MRAILIASSLACASLSTAQHQPVRVLERTEQVVTLGNDSFSVTVDRAGKLSAVTSGGREYVWMVALYTTPRSPDTGQGIRAVQGESSGGLGPAPELPDPEQRGECCVLTISRDCGRQEIHAGRPLYHLTQTVEVHPEGYLSLRYEFDWLHFFVMEGANLNVVLNGEQFTGRVFWADYTSHVQQETFTEGKDYTRIEAIRGRVRTLEVACDAGSFGLWVDQGADVNGSRWSNGKYYPIALQVPGTAYHAEMYPGMHTVLELGIKLPVDG